MANHSYNARWTDNKGRSHNFKGSSDCTDRDFIRSQVRAQTGAKDVSVNFVGGDSASWDDRRRAHNAAENERRRQKQSGGSSVFSGFSKSRRSSSSSGSSVNYSETAEVDGNEIMIWVVLLGGGWLLINFWPIVLIGGAVALFYWVKNSDD